MTIHELANASNAVLLDIPYNLAVGQEHFPPSKTDVLISTDGELVIGINRETGRFAAQRGGKCIFGSVDSPLPDRLTTQLLGRD